MEETKNFEIPIMIAKVRDSGSNTLEITIDHKVAKYLGIQAGDIIKCHIKKVEE